MSKKVLGQKTLSRCLSAMLLASALLLSLCACSEENSSGKTDGTQEMQSVETGENLIIPISEITETAKFYPVTVNGTQMEVIAVRDSNGKIRTAFNTCRICYDSGRGYYKQEGKALVCQNCGNRFTADQIGGKAVAAFRIRYQLRIRPLQTTAF
ncbi:MAG: Fe-S-containing protein [Eubacteriales bacterium]|nr:Fe-S-containing protein [Eubacteriales bacterium]